MNRELIQGITIAVLISAISLPISCRVIESSKNQARFSLLKSHQKARIMDIQDQLEDSKSGDLILLTDGQIFLIRRENNKIYLKKDPKGNETSFKNKIGTDFYFLAEIERVIRRSDLDYAKFVERFLMTKHGRANLYRSPCFFVKENRRLVIRKDLSLHLTLTPKFGAQSNPP